MWIGVVWCGVVWCGVVWCFSVEWCDVVASPHKHRSCKRMHCTVAFC